MAAILHTIWFLYLSILPFLPRGCDRFNLILIELLMMSWAIFKNECLVSLIIKKMKDPTYKTGSVSRSNDIEETIGTPLYNLGRFTYKLSFLYIYLRLLNFKFIPQFWIFALYLFFVVGRNILNSMIMVLFLLIITIFNTPGAPLSCGFCKFLS